MTAKAEIIPTRQSLLGRIKDWNDQDSWKDFFDTYWKLIFGVACKSGLNNTEAEEVVQETLISVAKNIQTFQYNPSHCSFKSWLLHVTRSRIIDHIRRRNRHDLRFQDFPDDAFRTSFLERLPDPSGSELEMIWDEEWQRNVVDAALEKIKAQVKPKHYQIFDLYVLRKWPVGEVTKALRVNIGQVYLVKHRISGLIKKEIKRMENRLTEGVHDPAVMKKLEAL